MKRQVISLKESSVILTMRSLLALSLSAFLAASGCHRTPPRLVVQPAKRRLPGEIVRSDRIRDAFPIRLGIVATRGLRDGGPEQEDCARAGIPLGAASENWLASTCDVVVLDAKCITPDTFPRMRAIQKLFTPLLFTYASEVFDDPTAHGTIGVWKPEMSSWQLTDSSGKPLNDEAAHGHWMDCGNSKWAEYFASSSYVLSSKYHSFGVLAADLPTSDTVGDLKPREYKTFASRVDATSSFLTTVHNPSRFMLVASSIGFETLIGRATLPVEKIRTEPQLQGRSWDEMNSVIDGAWCEGWVRPYWAAAPLNENAWEMQVEAADRAARIDNVFIASLAYTNTEELEYGLASYLLACHSQGRLVLQPMPVYPGEPVDAGMSLSVMQREFNRYRNYFDSPLGGPVQERHEIPATGGEVWRRRFQNGDVYVNSHDRGALTVQLAGPMLTAAGQSITNFTLGPHSGIILHNVPSSAKSQMKR